MLKTVLKQCRGAGRGGQLKSLCMAIAPDVSVRYLSVRPILVGYDAHRYRVLLNF